MNERGTPESPPVHVEVTGWDSDDESITWDGLGATEDEALENLRDAIELHFSPPKKLSVA